MRLFGTIVLLSGFLFPNSIYNDSTYSNVKNNLIGLSQQSYDWNQLITREIIKPFINNLKYLGCIL